MLGRTDLAIERFESEIKTNFSQSEEQHGEFSINRIFEKGNTHITISLPNLLIHGGMFENAENLLAEQISSLLPKEDGCVLVTGLGNREITPDALGPATVLRVIATRHINRELAKQINLKGLNPVAAIAPGVLGKTGIEAAEIIASVSKKIKPKAVIVIDALCAGCIERLGTTVQLSTAGITPGSGVKNSRSEISYNTLKVPVISIGVPTVIDAATHFKCSEQMVVTPKDIDLLIDRFSTLLGNALNICLQPKIDTEILRALV